MDKKITRYLQEVKDEVHRQKLLELITWVDQNYPELKQKYVLSQPGFVLNRTYIVSFSEGKHHLLISTEKDAITKFSRDLLIRGFEHTQMHIQVPWDKDFDYDLLAQIIEFNIKDKEGNKSFWKKPPKQERRKTQAEKQKEKDKS